MSTTAPEAPIRLAADGADIIALDICEELPTTTYPGATPEDLAESPSMAAASPGWPPSPRSRPWP